MNGTVPMPPEVAECTYTIEFPEIAGERLFATLRAVLGSNEPSVHAQVSTDDDGNFQSGTLEIIFDHTVIGRWRPFKTHSRAVHTFRILLGGEQIRAGRMYTEITLYTSQMGRHIGIWKPLRVTKHLWLKTLLHQLADYFIHCRLMLHE